MPLYRELRVKWSVFHRLLELTDDRMRHGTPDLPATLRRRRELLFGYSRLLQERGGIFSLRPISPSAGRCWRYPNVLSFPPFPISDSAGRSRVRGGGFR